ncbi:MAG: LuxR C-terminal-related transcriptional regulator [Terracoccus sp.]
MAGGGTAIDPEVVGQLLTRARPDSGLERISPREHDVLELMAEGLGNITIAQQLFVTEGAVLRRGAVIQCVGTSLSH